jgi:uncharacterized protein (UPF0332 family)
MNNSERLEYVKFRIDSAYETHKAAMLLFENGFWNSCVNRLYYSVFYAVNALLVWNEIQPKTHSTVKSQFSQHFVKTGKFETRFGRLLNTLYDWRQRGDYENLFMYNKESVEPLLESCLDMIQQIEAEINRNV